jgi:hypothetical protein
MRGSGGGSSVIIEGSLFAGHLNADVILEEIPGQLILRDNWNMNGAASHRP